MDSSTSIEKKEKIEQHELAVSPTTVPEDGPTFDSKRTAQLLRKLDRHIVPFLALLYLLSFLDRTNIGNARLAHLEKDLGMKGLDYNVALAIFFPFYVAAEIPSNMMLKRTRPSFWFAFIMLWWSICTTLMGLVKNYKSLLVVRAALGIAEGGLFPGVTFYITMWYQRHECGFRMAIFFSAATAAGAFGGLLARAITEMDGVGNLSAWAWIFIIEGLVTFIVAIWSYFQIHDFPQTSKFLTDDEKVEVIARLKADRSSLADEFDLKFFWQAIKDWKIYVHMLITIGIYTPLYSISLFLPTIVKTLGYTNNTAQLMSVPPYAVACLFTISGGFLADRYKQRGIFMMFFCALAIFGWVLLIASSNTHVQYAGTFFATSGIYANVPGGVAWNGNNIGGSTKRGVGIAMHVGFGNLGGVIGAFIFQSKHAPRYFPGFATLIGTTTMSFILCGFMTWYLRRENARRDRVAAENGWPKPEDYTEEQKVLEREKGDDASFFRYTV